jgi:hypothetical protein
VIACSLKNCNSKNIVYHKDAKNTKNTKEKASLKSAYQMKVEALAKLVIPAVIKPESRGFKE